MTAVALLFSIYMVKPSPFCVLDELDDYEVSVHRDWQAQQKTIPSLDAVEERGFLRRGRVGMRFWDRWGSPALRRLLAPGA